MRYKMAGVTSLSLERARVPLVMGQGGSRAGLVVLKPGSSFIAGTEAGQDGGYASRLRG